MTALRRVGAHFTAAPCLAAGGAPDVLDAARRDWHASLCSQEQQDHDEHNHADADPALVLAAGVATGGGGGASLWVDCRTLLPLAWSCRCLSGGAWVSLP